MGKKVKDFYSHGSAYMGLLLLLRKMPKYTLEFSKGKLTTRAGSSDFEKFLLKAERILKLQKALAKKMSGGVLQLILVSDTAIKKYNQEYRGINKATDVVSLSYFDEPQFPDGGFNGLLKAKKGVSGGKKSKMGEILDVNGNLVGEIIISVDTAKKQAREHGKTLLEEMQFLFVHGVLHVFGYDHEEPAERKVMFDLQDKIIGNKSWRPMIEKAYADLE
jgi:probable rRNA maturation factor